MRTLKSFAGILVLFSFWSAAAKGQLQQDKTSNAHLFTENKGQLADVKGKLHPEILFSAQLSGMDVFLRKNGFTYVASNHNAVLKEVRDYVHKRAKAKGAAGKMREPKHFARLASRAAVKGQRIDLDFEGSTENVKLIAGKKGDGYSNFYLAHCPDGITHVSSFGEVLYNNLYPGIDLLVYSRSDGRLKYDFIVHPGTDPAAIRMHYKGVSDLQLRHDSLLISTSTGTIAEDLPAVYQQQDGKKNNIPCHYRLEQTADGYEVRFAASLFDPALALIIDPAVWISYYGSSSDESCWDLCTDTQGAMLVTGFTSSLTFPVTVGAFQSTLNTGTSGFDLDAVVFKFDANGVRQWSTYYGGAEADYGRGIDTDPSGNVVFTGITSSTAFPVSVGAFQPSLSGAYNAFLVKFDPSGTRLWGTYYGGGEEDIFDITCDAQGRSTVSGSAGTMFPTSVGALQTAFGGGINDAVIFQFDPQGGRNWASYFGGTGDEVANGIENDANSDLVIAGQTSSSAADFPITVGAFQTTLGGLNDGFISKFAPSGSLTWSTFMGGQATDIFQGISIDGSNNIAVGGTSFSLDFPTSPGSAQPGPSAPNEMDAVLAKFDPAGNRLWATYEGNVLFYEWLSRVACEPNGNVYLYYEWEDAVSAVSIVGCAFQTQYGGIEDQFITKYDAAGQKICNTYLGGPAEEDWDVAWGQIVIHNGSMYFATNTEGAGFPTLGNPFQAGYQGTFDFDIVVGRLCGMSCGDTTAAQASFSYAVPDGCDLVFSPAFAPCDTNSSTYSWSFPGGTPASSNATHPVIHYSSTGSFSAQLIAATPCGADTVIQNVQVISVDCISDLSAPNVFTPGTDGYNDQFLFTTRNITELHADIYDRWGVKVGTISDPLAGWDGKSTSGKDCVDGVYYYVLKATGVDAKEYELTGFFHLIRGK